MSTYNILKYLPPISQNNNSIESALGSYGGWITTQKGDSILNDNNINEIDQICQVIIHANRDFQSGQITKCYDAIYELLYESPFTEELVSQTEIPDNSYFFRMRGCENEYLFSKEEMFHIPFEKRQIISNQRYSLSGYPCLYMGKSLYVCWEELNRPKIDTANLIALKTLRQMLLLDLRMPKELNSISDYYRLPLIIACSVKFSAPNSSYKPEYVISQAVLHAIIQKNNCDYSLDNYNGIIYYSSHTHNHQCLFKDSELFENIVVPTVNNTTDPNAEKIFHDGFCPVLCNTFETTLPISLNTFQLQQNIQDSILKPKEVDSVYSKSRLGNIESHLKSMPTQKISPCKFFRLNPDLLAKY